MKLKPTRNFVRLALGTAFCLACSSILTTAYAAPGSLDSSFNSTGIVTTPIGSGNESAVSIVVQPDGKILLGGSSFNGANNDFALVRYTSTGTLDTNFSGDGKVITHFDSGTSEGAALAVQPDGKILFAGESGTNRDFALVRYNSNGSLDASFGGGDGIVTTPIGSDNDSIASVVVQRDGKILVGGYSFNASNSDFALARYNVDGSLDTSFGDGDGKVTTDWNNENNQIMKLAVQPDGKIVCGGVSFGLSGPLAPKFVLLRYNSDGSLDSSFDGDGLAFASILGNDVAVALALQTDGKILLGGSSNDGNGGPQLFALVRFGPDGTLDTSFDGDGKLTTSIVGPTDRASTIALQPDGKILLAGTSVVGPGDSDFAVVRYNSNGSLDTSFGGGAGIVVTPIAGENGASAAALQPDGKILVGGFSGTTTNSDFALVRYLANDLNNDGIAESWDLTPDAFSFTDANNAAVSTQQTSAIVNVTGLSAGVFVPVTVSGGEYSINGGSYTGNIGYAQNGDFISVRHTSSSAGSTATNTVLTVGGMVAVNNTSTLLSTTTSDTFTSTTVAVASTPAPAAIAASGSGGGGPLDWTLVLMLGLPWLARRCERVTYGNSAAKKSVY